MLLELKSREHSDCVSTSDPPKSRYHVQYTSVVQSNAAGQPPPPPPPSIGTVTITLPNLEYYISVYSYLHSLAHVALSAALRVVKHQPSYTDCHEGDKGHGYKQNGHTGHGYG